MNCKFERSFFKTKAISYSQEETTPREKGSGAVPEAATKFNDWRLFSLICSLHYEYAIEISANQTKMRHILQ